ncbi:hypothetical protein V6Z11_D05G022000 [Gossypium hirsutum]
MKKYASHANERPEGELCGVKRNSKGVYESEKIITPNDDQKWG